jgi:hypothetical protein
MTQGLGWRSSTHRKPMLNGMKKSLEQLKMVHILQETKLLKGKLGNLDILERS